jgi:hypothetical protein
MRTVSLALSLALAVGTTFTLGQGIAATSLAQ